MSNVKETLYKLIDERQEQLIDIRRYLHQHPELSFEEEETAKYIIDFYKEKDCEVKTGVGGRGIMVTIDSGKPGKTLALRADFDALPIQEETGLPFASKNTGVMHACGHDGHTSYMMNLADALIEMKNEFNGKVIILHQPAEETPPGGAKAMIEAGCLDGVDNVLGVHLWAPEKFGSIQCTAGPVMTGRSSIKVKIQGKGGHGSAPNLANDANVAASFFITAIQTIVSRRVNPFNMATLTMGNFDGKGSFNVIKDSVFLEGDVRSMDEDTKFLIEKEFRRVLEGLSMMFGIEYELFYEHDYPVLNNDEELTHFVENSLRNSGLEEIKEIKTNVHNAASEDFAYFAQKVPSTFLFIGAMPDDGNYYPHHNPRFDFNEKSLAFTAKVVGAAALDYLTK